MCFRNGNARPLAKLKLAVCGRKSGLLLVQLIVDENDDNQDRNDEAKDAVRRESAVGRGEAGIGDWNRDGAGIAVGIEEWRASRNTEQMVKDDVIVKNDSDAYEAVSCFGVGIAEGVTWAFDFLAGRPS